MKIFLARIKKWKPVWIGILAGFGLCVCGEFYRFLTNPNAPPFFYVRPFIWLEQAINPDLKSPGQSSPYFYIFLIAAVMSYFLYFVVVGASAGLLFQWLRWMFRKLKRRDAISLVLLAGIFAWLAVAIFHSSGLPEPQYQGKKLTDWAGKIDQSDFFRQPAFQQHKAQSEQAIAAIRQIGTNALPVVLKLCAAKDSWPKRKLEEWAYRYNYGDWPNERHFPINIKPAYEKRYEGANIIWALGPVAEPAVPALVQLLQSQDREVAEDVMLALPGAGTNAIPSLTDLLNNTKEDVRIRAAIVLGDFRSQGRAAIPVLLQCLENPSLNQITRIRAIRVLGKIKENASEVVPVIIRHVQTETNTMLLVNYLSTLRNFGTNAKPAVPVLVNILESNSEMFSFLPMPKLTALAALLEIDPEAAKPFIEKNRPNIQSNLPRANPALE